MCNIKDIKVEQLFYVANNLYNNIIVKIDPKKLIKRYLTHSQYLPAFLYNPRAEISAEPFAADLASSIS